MDLVRQNQQMQPTHFVRTDDRWGLTREVVEEAVTKLQFQTEQPVSSTDRAPGMRSTKLRAVWDPTSPFTPGSDMSPTSDRDSFEPDPLASGVGSHALHHDLLSLTPQASCASHNPELVSLGSSELSSVESSGLYMSVLSELSALGNSVLGLSHSLRADVKTLVNDCHVT